LATAQYFGTYPGPIFQSDTIPPKIYYSNNFTNFYDQFLGTFILGLAILIITNEKSIINKGLYIPVVAALTVSAIISSFSLNCGAAINPSRDLGPR
jgi:aquaglyceroporin related protein, other eukaryote